MENKYKKWLSNVWITTLIFSPSIAFADSGQDTLSHVLNGLMG